MKNKLATLIACAVLLASSGCSLPLSTGGDARAKSDNKRAASRATPDGARDASDGSSGDTTDASEADESTRHDPCSLVTKEEMAAVLGQPVSKAVADGEDCNYSPGDDGVFAARVSWTHGEAAAGGMMGARAGTKMMKMNHPVEGLGDEAIFMPPAVLYVLKGDDLVTINLVLAPNALDKTKTLAEKALSHL